MSSTAPKHPKPPIPVATDIALHLSAKDGRKIPLSYWDLWYALLAKTDFGGDLNKLGQRLRDMRNGYFGQEEATRKLSHLRELQGRLKEAGLCVADILAAITPELEKTESRRAKGRIIKHNERSYELSAPMLTLPKERLYEAALRGMWPHFPVSPQPFYEQLRSRFNWRRFHEEDASWGLAKKLDAETEKALKLATKGKPEDAFAMLRSVLTVALELPEVADDSFGCIGMSFQQTFEAYLDFPRDKSGISPEVFLTDLLELLIFEDYGFTADHTDGFFAGLNQTEADFCLTYLRDRIPALVELDLDYQAEEALTIIGQVAAERKRFDLFESLAAEMQCREWQRIILLADTAVSAGKRDLALSVFRNALTDANGFHFEFLTKKCEQLSKGKWNPDPKK